MRNFAITLGARFSGLTGPVGVVLAACLINAAGINLVWSILALYADSLGASTTVVGAILAGFSATRLVANVPTGHLTGRFGHRRVMAAGLVVLAAGSLAPLTSPTLVVLAVAVAVQGFGSAVFTTSALVAIAALSTADTRVRDMANFQGAQGVGLSVGPALGGLIAAWWGYEAAFVGQAAMAVVALAAVLRIETAQAAGPLRHAGGPPRHTPVRLAAIAGLGLMAFFAFGVRIAAVWILMPLLAQTRLGAGSGTAGLLLTAGAVATLTMLPVVSRAARAVGRGPIIAASTLVALAGLGTMAAAGSLAAMFAAAILMGISSALAMPTLSAYAVDMAAPGRLGQAMGMFRTATDLAIVVGPVIMGLLIDQLGFSQGGALACAGAVLVAANAVFAATVPTRRG